MTAQTSAPAVAPRSGAAAEPAAARTIALLIETGTPGGAERVLIQLAQELRDRGHEVVPFVPNDAERGSWLYDILAGLGFVPEPFTVRGPYDVLLLWRLTMALRRRRVDVVHSHEFYMAVVGGVCSTVLRLPHVITLHGTHYYAERPLRVKALRWAARRSRGIVGVSAATAREISDVLGLGPELVRRIDNGIRFEQASGDAVRRELDVRPGELVVTSVGRIYPEKGHAVFVRALGELSRASGLPPWLAAIAGSGPEEERVVALAREQGLDGRLRFLGHRDDVAGIHAATDVFVLPSLSEGLPLALLEAMFAGAAIVASNVGGVPEAVKDGETALLVPPDDPSALAAAIRRLLENPAERKRLGQAAQRLVRERFDIAPMVDAYERLYEGRG
ncbi:MAG TPA: glycosyltransferase family 4 protein [Gemmatimonadaceae bacterium]|nr:glycosyltransferase family 4 protein [Gemmatimonadaceae bacterium]